MEGCGCESHSSDSEVTLYLPLKDRLGKTILSKQGSGRNQSKKSMHTGAKEEFLYGENRAYKSDLPTRIILIKVITLSTNPAELSFGYPHESWDVEG